MIPNQHNQTPSSSSHTHSTSLRASRTHLFDSTFWQVLPTNYDKIISRRKIIARLCHEKNAAVMTTDRAAGTKSLRAELVMLESDISAYRKIVTGIKLDELVGIYSVAGRQQWQAEQIAKEDIEDMEKSLKAVEGKIMEIRADVVYGLEKP